jgi:hypothetical protein
MKGICVLLLLASVIAFGGKPPASTPVCPNTDPPDTCEEYAQLWYDACITGQGTIKQCTWTKRQAYGECSKHGFCSFP